MQIAVLIGGVADPKWPLPPDLSVAALQAHAARYASLSPFDEAALELALKLRDADPPVQVVALVNGDDAFCRRICGWRPDAVHGLDLAGVPAWDGMATAAVLVRAVQALAPAAAWILLGREFSDWDDGTVPAALAAGLGAPQVANALAIARGPGGVAHATRQGSGAMERVALPARAVLSVTNEPRNRLRHPLMKNVMLAKKAVIPRWAPPPSEAGLACAAVEAAIAPPAGACEWVTGSAGEKARTLAQVLAEAAEG